MLIEHFLTRFYLKFKVDILIEGGAVGLQRNNNRYPRVKPKAVVVKGHVVRVLNPLPGPRQHKLESTPGIKFMDYAEPVATIT